MIRGSQPGRATSSMRSWLSLSSSSKGVMPSSRWGTWSRRISSPVPARLAISKLLEVRPAAPMSWMPMTQSVWKISRQASSRSFSVKGSPTCTVGRFSSLPSPNSAEAMLAPWMPSRPVLEPMYITLLPTPEAKPLKMRSARRTPRVKAFTRMLPL